jgi:D-arabinose 1-dehydrogenase-like Zn-dependent alcohol dehydrogenase
MRVVQIPRAGGSLELAERDIPDSQPGWVRIEVEACGICHSDSLVKEGLWPGIKYPRVPGHEVIGVVDAVGEGVKPWKDGQRVGVGWHGGNCGYCDHCRRGEFFACEGALLTTGISFDGGYAEYMVAPVPEASVRVTPADNDPDEVIYLKIVERSIPPPSGRSLCPQDGGVRREAVRNEPSHRFFGAF